MGRRWGHLGDDVGSFRVGFEHRGRLFDEDSSEPHKPGKLPPPSVGAKGMVTIALGLKAQYFGILRRMYARTR
jgi:hypothetical protein